MKEDSGAPVSTILDETYKIAITRFDNRIRVGGMAEIVGFNTELLKPRRETLEMVVGDLFRAAASLSRRRSGPACAHDPGRHADCGPYAIQKSVDQHRPRHAWLDHGLRFGPAAERPDLRADAGNSV